MGTNAKATASSKHVEFDLAGTHHDDDERDPLGILGGSSQGHGHLVDTWAAASPAAAAAATFESEASVRAPMIRAPTIRAERGRRRDPCEAIDAILRSSKDVRDRISSRQARVFEAYKVESHKLNKELAHLPATYDQYLAVREKVKFRRKQRSIVNAEEIISHPLEFHLRGAESFSPNAARTSVVENEQKTEVGGPANASDLEAETTRRAEEEEGNSNSGSDNDLSPTYLKADGGSVEQKGAHEEAAFRRCSTRARAGSAAENFTARQQFTCCHREERRQHSWKPRETPCKEEVPALRQSKIRGRYMVFSLLAAARDEEEDMEKKIIASKEATSAEEEKEREDLFRKLDEARARNARKLDALMTEYNPRPSRSRRDNTLEKLRVALPVPSVPGDGDSRFDSADGGGDYGNGTRYAQSERKEGGERETRWDNAGSGDGCTGEVSGGDHRDRLEGGLLVSGDDVHRVDRCEGVSAGEVTESHRESYGSDSQRCQPSEPLDRNESGAVIVGVSDGAGIVGPVTSPPPCSVESGPTVAEEGGGGKAVTAELRKRPATGQPKVPTLPDPNEVNNSVMADPFNMDHLKDLPGLTGGCNRGLSALVSETVSYTDPAFPNLEFHRRAAMDKAGYFMPGYKPRVISPGPDAGAYWLERRQSYRVKMAAPPHEQKHPQRQRGALNTTPLPTTACLQAAAQHHHNDATGRPTPNMSKR